MTWFNANEVKPDEGNDFQPLPNGEYRVCIAAAEEKQNSKGTGSYLSLRLEVVEGEHVKRLLFQNITTQHTNEKAATIGQGQLSALCRSIGKMTPGGPHDLVNGIGTVKVVVVNDDYKADGSKKNEVKAWIAQAPAQQSAPPAPAGGGNGQDW